MVDQTVSSEQRESTVLGEPLLNDEIAEHVKGYRHNQLQSEDNEKKEERGESETLELNGKGA